MRVFTVLFLLFATVPLAELYLLIKLGTAIGALKTVLIVIITGGLGAWLAKTQGILVIYTIRDQLNAGIIPKEALLEGILVLASGIVLLTPGLITDACGFLLLIPGVRKRVAGIIKRKISKHFTKRY